MNVWLTSANGFLGKELAPFIAKNFNLFSTTRNEVNLLKSNEVSSFIETNKIDIIIHNAIKGGRRIKKDEADVFYENVLMFENIANNANKVKKIINFDSGAGLDRSRDINNCTEAELGNYVPVDYYGFSKMVIGLRAQMYPNIYNLRIFNCFGIHETPERMITNNINRYLNKKDLVIHKDKFMDFFFIEDLQVVLFYYLVNKHLYKDLNLVYRDKKSLKDIATIINNLDEHRCNIVVENEGRENSYTGDSSALDSLGLNLKGLNFGIEKMYNHLKAKKNEG